MGKVKDVPEKAISEVRATTSQVSSGSALPQEKVKLAYKLLGVSSRVLRVLVFLDRVIYTDPLVFTFWHEVLGQDGSQAQDGLELNALRKRVKTLSSEKAPLHEKIKQLSKAKKG